MSPLLYIRSIIKGKERAGKSCGKVFPIYRVYNKRVRKGGGAKGKECAGKSVLIFVYRYSI